MAGFSGANTERLAEIEMNVTSVLGRLDGALAAEPRFVSNLQTAWSGADADDFVSSWSGLDRPALDNLAASLRTMGDTLRSNRLDQEQVSLSSGSRSRTSFTGAGRVETVRAEEGRSSGSLTFGSRDIPEYGSEFTGLEWKGQVAEGWSYGSEDDGVFIGQGYVGGQAGFDEDGELVLKAGAEATIAEVNLDGVLIGNDYVGLTGGIDAELLSADITAGYEDGAVGANVGVNFVSAGGETGLNIGGANVSASAEIGIKAELGFKLGLSKVEVKLPFVSFGFGIGGAK